MVGESGDAQQRGDAMRSMRLSKSRNSGPIRGGPIGAKVKIAVAYSTVICPPDLETSISRLSCATFSNYRWRSPPYYRASPKPSPSPLRHCQRRHHFSSFHARLIVSLSPRTSTPCRLCRSEQTLVESSRPSLPRIHRVAVCVHIRLNFHPSHSPFSCAPPPRVMTDVKQDVAAPPTTAPSPSPSPSLPSVPSSALTPTPAAASDPASRAAPATTAPPAQPSSALAHDLQGAEDFTMDHTPMDHEPSAPSPTQPSTAIAGAADAAGAAPPDASGANSADAAGSAVKTSDDNGKPEEPEIGEDVDAVRWLLTSPSMRPLAWNERSSHFVSLFF